MYIIVIGCGKVGSGFAEAMSQEGHDVVIVDNDAFQLEKMSPDFNGLKVTGVPIDQDVLKRAGIERADALAAVTPDDNINIMACQIAKELYKVKRVIARIYNPARESVFHQFGLDTICPTNISVDVIRSIILGDRILDRYTLGSNTLAFHHRSVTNEAGRRVRDLPVRRNEMLFGILRMNGFQFAVPDLQIESGDTLVVSARID
jgi:trk system potassium uptake protein TrkA